MKELIVVRHAKSDWGNEYLRDIDRPLSERGYNDAYFLGSWYSKNKVAPDRIVSSPATRAINTGLIFLREMNLDLSRFGLADNIYESPAASLLQVIQGFEKSLNTVMMVGHNPGFTDLSNQLSNDLFFENVPTCGIISFVFDVKRWSDVQFRSGRLNYYQFPKDFKNLL
jgi:phosphohistidine phosphatase